MNELTRRSALLAGSTGLAGLLAGCVSGDDGGGGANGTDDDTDDDTDGGGTGSDGDNGGTDDSSTGVDDDAVETLQVGSTPRRWFATPEGEAEIGIVFLHDTAASVVSAFWETDEAVPSAVEAFVDETDFDTHVVVELASVGPNACFSVIQVEDISVGPDRVEGRATVAQSLEDADGDESDEDDSGEPQECAQVVTFPSVLVRIPVDDADPHTAAFSITDGWGESKTVTSEDHTDGHQGKLEPVEGVIAPGGDPPAIPDSLECSAGEFVRHPQWPAEEEIPLGDVSIDGDERVSLRVERASYELGETVRISMVNGLDDEFGSGNRHKYNFQIKTAAGWEDVRGSTERESFEYTDEAILHPPGDGFEWSFELTEAGVVDGNYHEDVLTVCPALQEGRYRFLFWEPAVAVEFDVVVRE